MDWKFSTFILLLIAALIGIPWVTSEAGLCGLGVARAAITGADATACWEFWLNRYQGTLSAIVTGMIAAAGAVLLFRQTRATEIQVAAQRYDFLEKRIAEVRKITRNAEDLYRICARELHPGRMVRFDGPPTWAEGSLMSDVETPVGDFANAVERAQAARGNLIAAVEAGAVAVTVSNAALNLTGAALYFLDSCANEARQPVVNLGWGPQPEPARVRVRSPRSHHRFEQVVALYDSLNRAAKIEVDVLAARREAAKAVAL